MKTHSAAAKSAHAPTEAEIREKAHELYVRSGWIHGRDLENWLEAESFLSHDPLAAASHESAGHHGAAPAVHPRGLP